MSEELELVFKEKEKTPAVNMFAEYSSFSEVLKMFKEHSQSKEGFNDLIQQFMTLSRKEMPNKGDLGQLMQQIKHHKEGLSRQQFSYLLNILNKNPSFIKQSLPLIEQMAVEQIEAKTDLYFLEVLQQLR